MQAGGRFDKIIIWVILYSGYRPRNLQLIYKIKYFKKDDYYVKDFY